MSSIPMVCIAGCAVLARHFLMNWCAHLPRDLATLLHRDLDRDLVRYLDTLSDWPVMAHLLRDRSCYCGAVCAGDRYTHGDRYTVWHSYLARGLYRNFLAFPLCVSLALWGRLMVCNGSWMGH